jgi:5-(carboxyamino)imidazole ribonucleotide synthase
MKNLIGDDVEKWQEAYADPLAKVHLYGKHKVQPGRKMGHVTCLVPRR